MKSLYLSAAHKSSGKTTLSIGICAALGERGHHVQPFKKGPDYIDPIWLGMAAGNPCYNLDFFIAGHDATVAEFKTRSQTADISLIEGNKGLHDGLDLDGSNSNAALAKAIDSPVIMVVDARGTMRGIAPLLIGYQTFDPAVKIAGVIANMTGGNRHESKLRAAVEYYTDIPFLGAIDKSDELELAERHLGLIPGYEDPESEHKIAAIARAVGEHIDLDQIETLAGNIPPAESTAGMNLPDYTGLRIGIARDRAFGFYYPGDLEQFERCGVELVPFDTLQDRILPNVDGLFIGGGFPERHAAELEANAALRAAIRHAIAVGMPTYAECGGLMYLTRSLTWQGQGYNMVGAILGDTLMHERPCGRGYVKLTERENSLWPEAHDETMHAHEFHYSSIEGLDPDLAYAYDVQRGAGINHEFDGLIQDNLMASYCHLRHTTATPWVTRFLAFVSSVKSNQAILGVGASSIP